MAFGFSEAQTSSNSKKIRFGVVGGYTNLMMSSSVKTTVNSITSEIKETESGSGFFIGGVAEKSITKNIGIHLGLNYQYIEVQEDDASALNISLSGNYYLFNLFKREKRFSIELGVNYDLQFAEGAVSGIGVIAGVGYDITDKIFTNIRYIPTFANRYKTESVKVAGTEIKGDAGYNYLQIGVGYRLF